MATVVTLTSPQELADYVNSITLPTDWDVLGKRGHFTFVSPSDVVAGSNAYEVSIASSEDQLDTLIELISVSATIEKLIPHGGYWVLLYNTAAPSPVVTVINTYSSPEALANATGFTVEAGLDDSQAFIVSEGEILLSWGGTYTKVSGVPALNLVLPKGGYYTHIVGVEGPPNPGDTYNYVLLVGTPEGDDNYGFNLTGFGDIIGGLNPFTFLTNPVYEAFTTGADSFAFDLNGTQPAGVVSVTIEFPVYGISATLAWDGSSYSGAMVGIRAALTGNNGQRVLMQVTPNF